MPNNTQLIQATKSRVSSADYASAHSFALLRDLSEILNSRDNASAAQDLVLRALENRDSFGHYAPILYGFVRNLGLYPYLDPEHLTLQDRIAYEFHRPLNFDEDIVFHGPQAAVYRLLLDGSSVALSAPTSFGKSLVIDAMVASRRFRNVAIIVPTIALIDETRRRLARRFKDEFKIITHSSQSLGEKNIFVLTQERLLEFDSIDIDFFVIDEFYKLSPGRDDDDRCWLLNQAFYRLAKSGKQFYMLGPGIQDLSKDLLKKLERLVFVREQYHTVASDVTRIPTDGSDFEALLGLCRKFDEQTMIFCSSPRRATDVAKELIANEVGSPAPDLRAAANWISSHYHPEWHFPIALQNGIGIHHGRIPRALSQFVVRKFNEEKLRFLVCTSTLIEGVNTKAKNIIVFDNTIAQKEIDLFTFNNIQGRAGRMFEHYVGRVFIFYDPPQSDLPFVDVPVYSQDAPPNLLIQIDEADLTDKSISKLSKYKEQDLVSYSTLRRNVGIDLDAQLELAETISSSADEIHSLLDWTQMPTYAQLGLVCKLIWDHFGGLTLGARSVWNPNQLTFLINSLRQRPTAKDLILAQLSYFEQKGNRVPPDQVVQGILDFLRLWAAHHFPRLLRALGNIQADVFKRAKLHAGNYEIFAASVENVFLDPAIVALDEYGIPLELGRKLEPILDPGGSLDLALARLKSADLREIKLSLFEMDLIKDAKRYL